MPRITVAGGASNPAALPGEVGYIEPEPQPPEAVPVVAAAAGPSLSAVPAAAAVPDYASMTLAALRAAAKARGLSAAGSRADLAARLAEHDKGGTP